MMECPVQCGKIPREEILPSMQMLLLHFIYGGAQELSTSQAAKDLELTPTSISRASRQLEEMGLLHIRKVGVQRIMQSEDSPKTLFQKAGDKLLNPIKRTVYIPKELVGTELLESGYSALAEYSMLNTPNVRCYAAERISQWKDVMTNSLQNSLKQGKVVVDGVTVLDAAYLIPFKAKAWMDLTDRKAAGEHVDSKNIKKHKNDVFRLTELIDPTAKVVAPQGVYVDIQEFVQRMKKENLDIKQLGLVGRTKEKILEELKAMYETL